MGTDSRVLTRSASGAGVRQPEGSGSVNEPVERRREFHEAERGTGSLLGVQDVPAQLPADEFAKLEKLDVRLDTQTTKVGSHQYDLGYAEVRSLPALIQLVGHLKYKYSTGSVLLRGQASLYPTLSPSLFRSHPGTQNLNRHNRAQVISALVERSAVWTCDHEHHVVSRCQERATQPPRSKPQLVSSGTPRYAVEPLLQHYGIRTRWIDVVDNLWVALWFACHHFVTFEGSFQHVVRRVPDAEKKAHRYAYLLVVMLMDGASELAPGLFRSPQAGMVVDLRRAVPSFHLRPHAQHGLLVRPTQDDTSNLIVVPVKIGLRQALEWLGEGVLWPLARANGPAAGSTPISTARTASRSSGV